ncbi:MULTISPECIES: tetratricopeptide repeat protein [Paraburkholderia]|uniref:Tetratricopeptide repeat protein n=1 Tax=Paraburkholderia podalyriae TaxID=1938811 RepID=A0ABR7PWU2_9BURK|nr:tetratricopeptide repeat protein [Paraburkholderia podalyriae]MBC8750744.1 tetratricopeptide repeat protein [Paraburkholderia podalyriae]
MTSNGEGTTLAIPTISPRPPDVPKPDGARLERLLLRARKAHSEGSLQQAEKAYGELLEFDPEHSEALHLLGAVRFQQGRLAEAETLMRRSIERQSVPLALANHSAVLAGMGREDEALSRLDEALAINPAHQRAIFQRAGLLAQLGRHADAVAAYDRLIELAPAFADGFLRRSEMLRALGRLDDALTDCDRALALTGRSFEGHRERGLVLRALGRYREAADSYGHALSITPGSAEVMFLRGVAFLDLSEPERALADFNGAIAASPGFVDAIFNSSVALEQLGRHDEAITRCDRVLAIAPKHAMALANRGNASSNVGRNREAAANYASSLEIEPDSLGVLCNYASALMHIDRYGDAWQACQHALTVDPDYLPARFTRGRVLLETHRYDESLEDFARVLATAPRDKFAHFHRGNALRALRRHEEAKEAYAQAIEIDPDYVLAHCLRAFLCLSIGDFEAGWAEYEWRWRDAQLDTSRREFAQPRWTRDRPVADRTILLYAEQGLGDTLQFCRYVSLVKALGARVILESPTELKALLESLDGVDALVERGAPLPPFDLHCPLLSLPLEFQTDIPTIPSDVPYLQADRVRVERWRERLGPSGRPRVGLVWSGNPKHLNDRNRSMALTDLLPLLDDAYEWVSLQKVIRDEDQAALASSPIRSVGEHLSDFADTAALTQLMDCVVSVDTSAAHLAGALGRPLIVMLPHTPDFRWLLEREDSPWYPTARLYRQPEAGKWAPVVEQIRAALPLIVQGAVR